MTTRVLVVNLGPDWVQIEGDAGPAALPPNNFAERWVYHNGKPIQITELPKNKEEDKA